MEYDKHEPSLKIVSFERDIQFTAQKYEEYQDGHLIDYGETNISICISQKKCDYTYNGYVINIRINNNNLIKELESSFEFDICYTTGNRLLMMSIPKDSNVQQPAITMSLMTFGITREQKNYKTNEPWAGSLFTRNGRLVKVSFSLNNPQRLIEFYN